MGSGSYNKLCGGAGGGDDEERRGCVEWVEKYFKDCVCDVGSEMSFGLGIVSLIFWGIAEIPQLLTNFRTKSAHGVSVAFLLTWFIGDIFNLVGCHLEQATLPTQYYTALLYTAVTAVLIVQTFYYGYYAGRHRKGRNEVAAADDEYAVEADQKKKPLLDPKSKGEETKAVGTVMIRASNTASPRSDSYYMSARSLASSGTPSYLQQTSYLRKVGSGPSTVLALHNSSSEDEDDDDGATPVFSIPHHLRPPATPSPTFLSPNAAASCATFIIGAAGLPSQANSLMETNIYFHGRRLLKNAGLMTALMESNPYGIALGWVMAAIYMGGRLPQIYLNMKRGGVEGLNPLMFMFAIIANATYVGSILARSVEWEMIKGNAPWLLDAIICVLLDLFIMMQFAYYKFVVQGRKNTGAEEEGNDNAASSIEGPNKSAIA